VQQSQAGLARRRSEPPPARVCGYRQAVHADPGFSLGARQRLDQTLLDLQLPEYQRVLAHAGPEVAVMIASGDVLLRFARELPTFPSVDVLGLGMWVTPEKAREFGVFFRCVTSRRNWRSSCKNLRQQESGNWRRNTFA